MSLVAIVISAVFGLVIGSFMNVVIHRVPLGQSIVKPSSSCPNCGIEISNRDNIPIISWLILKGKCHHCKAPISLRYPLVELGCGIIFAVTTVKIGLTSDLAAYLVLMPSLLALALIDFYTLLIPKKIVYSSFVLVLVLFGVSAAISNQWDHLFVAVACAVGWFVIFFMINLIRPKALGFGDVRLGLLVGLGLGWLGVGYVILGFFVANLVGSIIGVALILSKRIDRKQQFPYGVFLAIGAAFAIYFGSFIVPTLQRYF